MDNPNENKISRILKRILENMWLIVAILAAVISVKETINAGFKNSLLYYAFVVVAVFFYLTRRNQRLKA